MNNVAIGSKHFLAIELSPNIVLLKVVAPYFSENCVSFFNNSTSLLINQGYKKLIIDLTETEYLDTTSVSMMAQKMVELNSIGGSIKLVVTEDRPRLTFSVGNNISQIRTYLTVENALKDFNC
jgi:anti-anti-sigma regulatory factor